MACSEEFPGGIGVCPHDGNMLVPLPSDPWVGRRLNNYQIREIIGTGGMGVVYMAYHELMDKHVAIKMLRAALVTDTMSVKRFTREAQAASKLNHPHIISMYDHGFTNTGQPFMVMDYLRGHALSQVIKENGQVGVDRAINILVQSCEALDHAHKNGVIHRDLKPANIMLITAEDQADFVKVVDFGVAKVMQPGVSQEAQSLTQAGEVCGSPVYMSPEQCLGKELDNRSDIYSMGVLIYETLTGKLPFLGKNMVETMQMHVQETPKRFTEVRPDLFIPERVEAVVLKALGKDPELRPQTMGELANDLRMAIPRPDRGFLRAAIPADPSLLKDKEKQRKEWIMLGIIAGAAAAVIGGGLMLMSDNQPKVAIPSQAVTPPVSVPAPALVPAVTPTTIAPPAVAQPPVAPITNPVAVVPVTPKATVPVPPRVVRTAVKKPIEKTLASSKVARPATPRKKTESQWDGLWKEHSRFNSDGK
jgi:serine/threonine-protein kinase